jgi:hypothetical protein
VFTRARLKTGMDGEKYLSILVFKYKKNSFLGFVRRIVQDNNLVGSMVMKLVKLFLGRLPDSKSIIGLYAVIVTLIYSWTLFTSFYKLPSWMFYLTIGQILSVYAYSFSTDLVESILILAGVLFLEFTLFLALKNKEEFQARSVLIVTVVLISSMLRLALFQAYEDIGAFLSSELIWWAIALPFGIILAVFAPKNKRIRNIFAVIGDRTTVFLYVYLPISFISLIVVIVRNIYR